MPINKKLKIGLVGCGAIGSSLARYIFSVFANNTRLAALYDLDRQKADKLADEFGNHSLAVSKLSDLISRSDLVIEATSSASALEIAQKAIRASCDIMIMSVGGILKDYPQLRRLSEKKGVNIFVPSGAIAGIDALKAAACGKIKKVILTTSKPAKAFLGVPYVLSKKIRLDNIQEDAVLFEGNAWEAIKAFPQNINVAATLSLAGIGPRKTTVRIVASSRISRNIHQIEVHSDSGTIISRTENVVHADNPKTSYLAVLSAIATLKQILQPIKIGT
jgi:aspartate dehydrogenase